MPICGGSGEDSNRSKQIEKLLENDKKKLKDEIKLLLLGIVIFYLDRPKRF